MIFHFPENITAGSVFEKEAYQYARKNCPEEDPILKFDLSYNVLEVDGFEMLFQLRNGTFQFAEVDPPYCAPLQSGRMYNVK